MHPQLLNLTLAALDLAVIFAFGGLTGDMSGAVEPKGASSLVFTLYVGLLSMPGAIAHVLLAGTLSVDAAQIAETQKEKLAQVLCPALAWQSWCHCQVCGVPYV